MSNKNSWPSIALVVAAFICGSESVSAQGVHFDLPAPEGVAVQSETLGEGRIELFSPSDQGGVLLPAVIFVIGHPDDATSLGPLIDYPQYRDWARIVAASGIIGVLYSVREPVDDLAQVAHFLVSHGPRLGVDTERIALWSASANVPTALGYARSQQALSPRALVVYYGLMPTPDGFQDDLYRSASARAGFALPPHSPDQSYPADLPFLVVRAGLDASEALLASIDHFVAYAHAGDLNVQLLNHTTGRHSFDSRDDTPETRQVIAETLTFLARHLEP